MPDAKGAFCRHAFSKKLIVHILHDHAGARHALPGLLRLAVPKVRAGRLPVQAAERAGKGGLARAVMPHHRDDLAGRSPQGDILQNGLLLIGQGHVFHFQRRLRGGQRQAGRALLPQIHGPQAHFLPPRRGNGPERFHRPIARNAAILQIKHTIGHIQQIIEPVLRDNDGFPLGFDQAQMLPQCVDGRPVQVGGRLVRQIHAGVHGVNRREGDLLLFPAGERKNIAAKQVFNVQRRSRLRHAALKLPLRNRLVFHAEGDFAVGIHIEKLRAGVLEHAAHPLRNAVHGQPAHILPVQQHAPGQLSRKELRDQAVDQPRQRGFAAAAAPAEQHALPVRDREADIL